MPPRARPSSSARTIAFAVAVAGLGLFVWLAVQVHRSQRDPEGFRAWDSRYAWIVGPPADALNAAAAARMARGLETLNDGSRPPAERVRGYREQLGAAEALLLRSLRAQPAQARTLAQLAAVRWELEPPLDEAAVARHVGLIDLASRMAPTVSRTQLQLGELLLKMGLSEEANAYFRRTIELDPQASRRVVGILTEQLVPRSAMLAALPHRPETLVALEATFRDESAEAEYVEVVEPALTAEAAQAYPALLRSYANACLRLDAPERLRERLDRLGPQENPEAEAARRLHRSRAWAALGRTARAIDDAREARRLLPHAAHLAEHFGGLLVLQDAPSAIREYRAALGLLVQQDAEPAARARLYRKIGEAEDRRGDASRAYDAYRRALELAPNEPVARRRLREMRAAAGVEPSP